MADWLGSYPHFHLNFEQQRKRAKELLKAAQAGDPKALARFKSPPKLVEAQNLTAQELRFDNWATLKRHIAVTTDRSPIPSGDSHRPFAEQSAPGSAGEFDT